MLLTLLLYSWDLSCSTSWSKATVILRLADLSPNIVLLSVYFPTLFSPECLFDHPFLCVCLVTHTVNRLDLWLFFSVSGCKLEINVRWGLPQAGSSCIHGSTVPNTFYLLRAVSHHMTCDFSSLCVSLYEQACMQRLCRFETVQRQVTAQCGFGRSPGRLSVCSVFLTLSLFRRTHTCCVFHGGADDFTQASCQIRAKGKERKPGRILLFLLVTFSHVPFTIGSSHDLHFKYFTMGLSHDLHSTSFLSYEKHVTLWQRMIQIRMQR